MAGQAEGAEKFKSFIFREISANESYASDSIKRASVVYQK